MASTSDSRVRFWRVMVNGAQSRSTLRRISKAKSSIRICIGHIYVYVYELGCRIVTLKSRYPYFRSDTPYSRDHVDEWNSYEIPKTRSQFTAHHDTAWNPFQLPTRITSKLKVLLITRFCVLIYHFSISLTVAVLQRQKSLPDIGGTIQDVGCHGTRCGVWRPHHWWAMSLYFKCRAIYFWFFKMNINGEMRPIYITLYDS